MTERFAIPDTYAAWSKDSGIRFRSTSGGAFSEFAEAVLSDGGLVAGAVYNESNLVEHVLVDSSEGIEKLRQSKYLSSSLGSVFKRIKEELERGSLVAFCGAPCQVAGLHSFLGKEYDGLFTMDFICRGMNSPKAFRAWLEESERQEGSRATRVWFKYKEGGWRTSPRRTRVDFEDGTYKVYEGDENLYMQGYLTTNLYMRPCCGSCRFKGFPRKSDVTFADFWGVVRELDDDKGTSMILINSIKGRKYLEKVKGRLELHKRSFDEVFAGNPMLFESATVPKEAHGFLADLDRLSFSSALKKYGGYPVQMPFWKKKASRIKRFISKILGRR